MGIMTRPSIIRFSTQQKSMDVRLPLMSAMRIGRTGKTLYGAYRVTALRRCRMNPGEAA